MNQLSANANQLLSASMEWMDARWDESAGWLKLDPALSFRGNTAADSPHYVRETAFYALGLFLRNLPGDNQRALRALDQVLLSQLIQRETEYDGSFPRHPEELVSDPAVEWVDFNPNWREYIGSTLAIILCEFSERLPEDLLKRTDSALRRATAGSLWRRVPAEYTHIAIIKAFLLSFAGERYQLEAWLEGGEMQAREIFRLFKEHQCFPTYNSPTHYGIDLFALALWQKYCPSQVMKTMAAEMETALWEDIAQFYHAGMGNLSGPYDRAFGMDMHSYASPLGLGIWASIGKENAPFPDLKKPFPQQHDLAFAIPLLITGVAAPAGVLAHFRTFQWERRFERLVSDPETSRTARTAVSAWVAKEIMLGGSALAGPSKGGPKGYPATVHWMSGNGLGWICAQSAAVMEVHAGEQTLSIHAKAPEQAGQSQGSTELVIKFLISSPAPPIFTLDKWSFPGLTVRVSSNLTFSAPAKRGELFEIECRLPNPDSAGPQADSSTVAFTDQQAQAKEASSQSDGAFVTLNFQK